MHFLASHRIIIYWIRLTLTQLAKYKSIISFYFVIILSIAEFRCVVLFCILRVCAGMVYPNGTFSMKMRLSEMHSRVHEHVRGGRPRGRGRKIKYNKTQSILFECFSSRVSVEFLCTHIVLHFTTIGIYFHSFRATSFSIARASFWRVEKPEEKKTWALTHAQRNAIWTTAVARSIGNRWQQYEKFIHIVLLLLLFSIVQLQTDGYR